MSLGLQLITPVSAHVITQCSLCVCPDFPLLIRTLILLDQALCQCPHFILLLLQRPYLQIMSYSQVGQWLGFQHMFFRGRIQLTTTTNENVIYFCCFLFHCVSFFIHVYHPLHKKIPVSSYLDKSFFKIANLYGIISLFSILLSWYCFRLYF